MKFEGIGDKRNEAKLVQEIIMMKIKNDLPNLVDDYSISEETIENLGISLYVNHNQKVLWKAGRTEFVKGYSKEVSKLIKKGKATFNELGFLLYLASEYTEYEDNYLKNNGEYLTKKELIKQLHNDTKDNDNENSSESYYKKLIIELEKKNLILSEPHPKDKRNKVFYLTPHLFYKGKYMDSKVREKLLTAVKEAHAEIKKLKNEGKITIPLDDNFELKEDDTLIGEILEYLNEAS